MKPSWKVKLLSVAMLSVAGCSSLPGSDVSASNNGGGGPQKSASSAPAPAQPSPLPSDTVLAGRTAAADGFYKLKIDLLQLDREGKLVTVNYAVTVTGHDRASGWDVGDAFSAVPSDDPSADGVYLIDAKNGKKHLVARDAEQKCVCTDSTESIIINTDQTVTFTATFAAPPEDVTAMDVYIPLAGTFKNVPLT
ncbi:hypothetical protein AB0D67_29790 [Streptosporangium sp. NPDC048047]|uniref:hypothetical protein n=1 Tax=Streptosporangium sp. NPDC048047 TaxID=3155748 RepID=UPI0034206F89